MKVILLQDVTKIGRRFEIAEVPSGYALNKLIPQGLAQEATPQNVKNVKARAAKSESDREATSAAFSEALEKLAGNPLTVSVEANEQGHLFEALKSKKLEEVFKAEGIAIGADQIHIHEPIKAVGEHTLELVSGDQKGEVTINVVAG